MKAPPTRYRVVERGRRLVTIDTHTGEEFGAGLRAASDPAAPRMGMMSAPPAAVPLSPLEAPAFEDRYQEPDTRIEAEPPPLSEARSALSPARPAVTVKLKPGGMLPLAVFIGVIVVIFLIATNLWVFVLIAMLVPQIRAAAFDKAKAAIRKLKDDQAAAG